MTNNHILGKKQFNSYIKIKIYFEQSKKEFNISLNDIKFKFTDELIDITFIELKEELIEKIHPKFLIPNEKDCVKDDPIYVFQYPINEDKEQYLAESPGTITDLYGIHYCHKCSTYKASSGSPLIDSSLKVVGIHKASSDLNENYATKMTVAKYAVCTTYERVLKKEIFNTIDPIKLSKDDLNEIEKHQLEQQKILNLFKYKGNELIKPIYFYRTNHAWYWTEEDIEEDIKKKKNNIRNSKWSIIIPHEEINKNYENPFHNNLIMWLKLSESMYL